MSLDARRYTTRNGDEDISWENRRMKQLFPPAKFYFQGESCPNSNFYEFDGLTVEDKNTGVVYNVRCIEQGLFLRRAIDTGDPELIESIAKAVEDKGK